MPPGVVLPALGKQTWLVGHGGTSRVSRHGLNLRFRVVGGGTPPPKGGCPDSPGLGERGVSAASDGGSLGQSVRAGKACNFLLFPGTGGTVADTRGHSTDSAVREPCGHRGHSADTRVRTLDPRAHRPPPERATRPPS